MVNIKCENILTA